MQLAADGRTLISTTEAHQRSGLSRDHISLMVRRGILDAAKIGNYWLIYEDSFERFIAQPRKRGPKGPRVPKSDGISL
jgi:excisionase family DNA binding protein